MTGHKFVTGNKQKGISVRKLNYKNAIEPWRVGFWENGRMVRVTDYSNRKEALSDANYRKRKGW